MEVGLLMIGQNSTISFLAGKATLLQMALSCGGGISEKYAAGATGDVHVIQTSERAATGGGFVWKNAEKAVLENSLENGVVTKIHYIILP